MVMGRKVNRIDRNTFIQGSLICDLYEATGFYDNGRLDREALLRILTKIQRTKGFHVDLNCLEEFEIKGMNFDIKRAHVKITQQGTDFYVRIYKLQYRECYCIYYPHM